MKSHPRKVYREGQRFGNLIAIEYIKPKSYLCLCDCGKNKIIKTSNLVCKKTTSCGCLRAVNSQDYQEKLKEKLLKNIKIDGNGCWIWQKSKHRQGYGNFCCNRKVLLAHRVSWTIFKGNLDLEILVCHTCDNPPCCNPEHLFLGTDKDNSIDAFSKGRIKRHKGENHARSKFKNEDIENIRSLKREGKTQKEISEMYSVTISAIKHILKKRTWIHIP